MKKYIYTILCTVASTLLFVACSDDMDNPYATASSMKIVSSNILFDAPACTGSIDIESSEPVKAESSASWCSTEVDGNTIKVTATRNTSLNGRTAIITITNSKNDTLKATALQQGMRLKVNCNEVISGGDFGFTQTYDLSYNIEPSISSSVSWLRVEKTNKKLTITADANTEGHLREGYIKMSVGDYKDSICVKQYDFSSDIAGDYYLVYTDDETKQRCYINARLALSGTTYRLNLTDVQLAIPVSFDETACSISFKPGQYVGIKLQRYLYTALLDSKSNPGSNNMVSLDPAMNFPGDIHYGKVADNGDQVVTYASFKDNGSWVGKSIDALLLYSFSKKNPTADYAIGAAMTMINPVLIKK